MSDRPANGSGNTEAPLADIDAATKRLMAALDALESSVERLYAALSADERRQFDSLSDRLFIHAQALRQGR